MPDPLRSGCACSATAPAAARGLAQALQTPERVGEERQANPNDQMHGTHEERRDDAVWSEKGRNKNLRDGFVKGAASILGAFPGKLDLPHAVLHTETAKEKNQEPVDKKPVRKDRKKLQAPGVRGGRDLEHEVAAVGGPRQLRHELGKHRARACARRSEERRGEVSRAD